MTNATPHFSLAGWDIGHADATDWVPWGASKARAKVLASGDGHTVALVEAEPGYEGGAHEHQFVEFLYLLQGDLVTQGRTMRAGDAYAASAGSTHDEFLAPNGATYVSIFRLA